ncbi:MAG TPA: FAD-dependent oxidoreductase [Myxococcota bacterium]|nr:FAD-dependent oxidoreductase [Myxococcota bacterium]
MPSTSSSEHTPSSELRARCCIAGGGPAGMMLGLLLARAGVDVVVLEKHADFLRDFRGDTVHPSTLEVMHELGLLPALLARPHQEVRQLALVISGRRMQVADFTHLPSHARFVALMPQWDFLDFVAEHAQKLPSFRLLMRSEVVDLVRDGTRVTGVRARGPAGELAIASDLVVAADGRHSRVRERAGLEVQDFGAPIDVIWLRVSRKPGDPSQVFGHLSAGHLLVLLDRGDYWQCAYVIRKGARETLEREGLGALRGRIASLVPFLADRVHEIQSFDDVKLLTVRVDRLREWWRPGLLCIGDAAHAMSPVGGVGINLAIQDAVAVANLLAEPLRRGAPTPDELAAVQRRREWPTRLTQNAQIFIQDRLVAPALAGAKPTPPLALRLLDAWPWARRIPARLVGLGARPEHVSEQILHRR